jgi:hypothetical protein
MSFSAKDLKDSRMCSDLQNDAGYLMLDKTQMNIYTIYPVKGTIGT